MVESFYVGTYWGDRQESAGQCAARAARCLACLADVDPILARWFERGRSRTEALQHQIGPDPVVLEQLFAQGSNRRDAGGQVLGELGFRIGLWNGGADGETAGLTIACACYARVPGINSCVLTLPTAPGARERTLGIPVLTAILGCLVEAWEPDWGIVTSNSYQPAPPASPHEPRPGWLIYLPHNATALPDLPPPARTMPLGSRGTLVIATDQQFTAANPDHVAAVEQVANTLRQSGVAGST